MLGETRRIIGKKELLKLVPYSAQHILRLEKKKLFPQRISVGARRVGWYLDEILAWMTSRPRGGAPAARYPRLELRGASKAAFARLASCGAGRF